MFRKNYELFAFSTVSTAAVVLTYVVKTSFYEIT